MPLDVALCVVVLVVMCAMSLNALSVRAVFQVIRSKFSSHMTGLDNA
jgi:hypothetical protein